MDWTVLASFMAILAALVTIIAALGTMWWQFNSRLDALNKLLTDNLIALNRYIGELKGASHPHLSPLN